LRQLEREPRLAPDLLEGGELALIDLLFGAGAERVDELEQEIDQHVGESLSPPPAEQRHRTVADHGRMAPEFADRFGGTADHRFLLPSLEGVDSGATATPWGSGGSPGAGKRPSDLPEFELEGAPQTPGAGHSGE
jgi:hypothetical protein